MKPIIVLLPTRNRPRSLVEAIDSLFANGSDLFDILVLQGEGGSTSQINSVPMEVLRQYEVMSLFADDCRMRTPGWDSFVMQRLGGSPGLVYGRDGIQDERIATHPFVSTKIIEALGFVTPPELKNYYADNFLMEVVRPHGRLIYTSELFIEHMHFSVGKSPHDETYSKAEHHYAHDKPAWSEYCKSKLALERERIKPVFTK